MQHNVTMLIQKKEMFLKESRSTPQAAQPISGMIWKRKYGCQNLSVCQNDAYAFFGIVENNEFRRKRKLIKSMKMEIRFEQKESPCKSQQYFFEWFGRSKCNATIVVSKKAACNDSCGHLNGTKTRNLVKIIFLKLVLKLSTLSDAHCLLSTIQNSSDYLHTLVLPRVKYHNQYRTAQAEINF